MHTMESQNARTYRDGVDLIEAASQLRSEKDIHALCQRLCQQHGFDHYIYGAVIPTSLVTPETRIVSGYPDAWWQHYLEEGFFAVDPVVHHTLAQATVPLSWEQIDTGRNANSRHFMQRAGDFGLRSGVSFPAHGRNGECGIFSLVSKEGAANTRQRVRDVMAIGQLMAGFLHEAVVQLQAGSTDRHPSSPLTERERDCLMWAAEGKTNQAIGDILGITVRTVRFHCDNAAAKLGVTTRTQAVARAVAQGHITPQL